MVQIGDHVRLYGNTEIQQKYDIDFNRFCSKLNIINTTNVKYSFLKDNFGDYWIIQMEQINAQDCVIHIPDFVKGLLHPIQLNRKYSLHCLDKMNIANQIERFNGFEDVFDKDILVEIYAKTFGILIAMYGTNITIVGPSKPLEGSILYLLRYIKANKVKFKSFDISNVNTIESFCCNSTINELELNGINFGKPKQLNSFVCDCKGLKMIDISNIDLQECEDIQLFSYSNIDLEVIKLPKQAIKVNITLRSLFDGCENLKYVNIQDLDFASSVSLEYSFKDCTSLEKLDMRNIKDKFQVLEQIDWCPKLKSLILNSDICENKAELLNSLRYKSCSNSLIIEWV